MTTPSLGAAGTVSSTYSRGARSTHRGVPTINTLSDSLLSLRRLCRAPAFTAVVAFSLAIGVGSSAALIEFARVTHREPVAALSDSERLIALYVTHKMLPGRFGEFDFQDYQALAAADEAADLAAYAPLEFFFGSVNTQLARRVAGVAVTPNYFEVLGVAPELGGFPDPDNSDSNTGMVISYNLWKGILGGRSDVIGRRAYVNEQPVTIIGVAQRKFRGVDRVTNVDAWIPIAAHSIAAPPRQRLLPGDLPRVRVLGRLRGGVDLDNARSWLEVSTRRLWEQDQSKELLGARAFLLQDVAFGVEQSRSMAQEVRLLAAGSVLVLLVACLNLSTIMLTRSLGYSGEISIRAGLGASPWAAVRPVVLEPLLLTLAGGLGALLVGRFVIALLSRLWLPDYTATDPELTARYFLVSFFLIAVVSLLAIAAPLLVLHPRLKELQRLQSRGFWWEGVAATQLAVALPLVLVASLLFRTVNQLSEVNLGYEYSTVMTGRLDLGPLGYDPDRSYRLLVSLEETFEGNPDFGSMAFTVGALPLQGPKIGQIVYPATMEASRDLPVTRTALVSEHFLHTLRWPLKAGRWFGSTDGPTSALAAVVNEAFLKQFPSQEIFVGSRLQISGVEAPLEVVGIVKDVRLQGPRSSPEALVLLFAGQYSNYKISPLLTSPGVVIRGEGSVPDVANVRATIATLEPRESLYDASPLKDRIRLQWAPQLQRGVSMLILAGLALILGCLGVASVVSHTVKRRARELCVRMAVGASPASIRSLLLKRALTVVVIGVVLGSALYGAVRRVLAAQLEDLPPMDAPALVLIAAAVAGTALAAALPGIIRFSRMGPAPLLREENTPR